MGVGGAQRPVWRINEPKKTGARSARSRTRGQNQLVSLYGYIDYRYWTLLFLRIELYISQLLILEIRKQSVYR
jgi:hypothetical protein